MSRRDTIIIAVLINACLLIVLFATAVTKKEETPYSSYKTKSVTSPAPNINIQDVQRSIVKESSFKKETTRLEKPTLPTKVSKTEPPKVAATPPPPPEKPKAVPSYLQITVKRGDYLEKIAKENNSKVADIMKLNQLKTTQLRIGQILKIPTQSEETRAASKKPPAPKQYVVQSGDTLWAIAKNHSMQVSDLLKMNHMSSDSANRLQPGDTLLVR